MRTTVTIDDDVQILIRRAMRSQDAPFKRVLNDAIRAGLSKPQKQAPVPRFVQRTFDMGEPMVDLTKANALLDELEARDYLAKSATR